GATDNYFTFASDYGDVTTYWHGVDTQVSARLANRLFMQVGMSGGRGPRDVSFSGTCKSRLRGRLSSRPIARFAGKSAAFHRTSSGSVIARSSVSTENSTAGRMKHIYLIVAMLLATSVGASQYPGNPYAGTAAPLPGTVLAANFDNGGEGVAYHDNDPGNLGGGYRPTGVDIESSSNGDYDVGWIAAGEWLNYTVNVASAGTYAIAIRVASPNSGASMHVGFNNASNVWKTIGVPNTGGWQKWTTVSFTATLGAGVQQLTILSDTGGYNFDQIVVSVASGSSPPPSSSNGGVLSPYGGAAAPVPGMIQAENFDNGGPGIAYSDTTSGNAGGAYRSTDVDIEPASGGGYDVGWIAAGEWLNYTVNVVTAGTYVVQL